MIAKGLAWLSRHLCVLLLVFSFTVTGCDRDDRARQETVEQTYISLSGAWALYPMVVKWAEEFQKTHPEITIDIAAGGAGKGMTDCLAEVVDLGMVSREIYEVEIEQGAWWVAVTKDAVVPTMNARNPWAEAVMERGITREVLAGMWVTGDVTTWGEALGNDADEPIRVYTRSDACGAGQTWAQYLGKRQEDLLGTGVYGDPGLAEAVRQDVLGVGFNNVNFAYDSKTQLPLASLMVLPIDLNGNGTLDADENFYGNRDELLGAIADGRYPSPPGRVLYLVCHGKPRREAVRVFLQWILTEGQAYVSEGGYIPLSDEMLAGELTKVTDDGDTMDVIGGAGVIDDNEN